MATRADNAISNLRSVSGLPATSTMSDNAMLVLANAGFSTGSFADRMRAYLASNYGAGVETQSDKLKLRAGLTSPPPVESISELV